MNTQESSVQMAGEIFSGFVSGPEPGVTVKELADALKRVINATQCNPRRPDIAAALELLRRYER